jgi:6-phosphogluconate dehydrogenase
VYAEAMMRIGLVGLGRMGGNMARRLRSAGHDVVVHDRDPEAVARLAGAGFTGAASLAELVAALAPPRAVWVMVPAGAPTELVVSELGTRLEAGDVVVDGGNSYFKDGVRRAAALAMSGVAFLDVGVSGGVWGAERGYCLMIGGDEAAAARLEPVFRALAPGRGAAPETPGGAHPGTAADGFLHCGPAGAGHFVKMVHNGIEYGLMEAYAEGLDLLASARGRGLPAGGPEYRFDVAAIAELWRRGSVVSSWLLDLAALALRDDPRLEKFAGHVADSGEGRWTVEAAVEEAVPAPVLATALFARFRSRRAATFGEKVLSALRAQFGAHREAELEEAR